MLKKKLLLISIIPTEKLLNFVILDLKNGNYCREINIEVILSIGIEFLDFPVADINNPQFFDESKLIFTILLLT